MAFLRLTAFINLVLSSALAVVVFYRCPDRKLALRYGLLNVDVAIFSLFYFLWQRPLPPDIAAIYLRNLSIAALWINYFFLNFVFTLVGTTPVRRRLSWGAGVLSAAFSWMFWNGVLYHGVEPRFGCGYWGNITPWFSVYLAFWHLELFLGFVALAQAIRTSSGDRRNQLRYVMIAFGVGYLGGFTNWPYWYNVHIPPYGNAFTGLYGMIVAYAIVKHHLMDISVVIKKTLVYSIVSASLIAIYVSTVTLIAHLVEGHVVSPSAYSSAIAAGVITLLFDPLRNRIQAFIDRRFSRAQIDRAEKLATFSAQIIDEEDLNKTTRAVCDLLMDSFQLKSLAFYLKAAEEPYLARVYQDGQGALPERLPLSVPSAFQSADDGAPAELPAELRHAGVCVAAPIVSRGNVLGCLLLGEKRSEQPYSDDDFVLLRLVCNQAALAYERPKLLREASDGLVHEIKTPLAHIVLPAELTYLQIQDALRQNNVPADLLPTVQKRMKYIMDQMLLASHRVDALQQMNDLTNRKFAPVEAWHLISSSLEDVEELLSSHDIHVSAESDDTLPPIRGNLEQLKIVLVNLFKNAAEAMSRRERSAGTLRVETRRAGEFLEILVEDTGPGIPPLTRELIFQSHYSTKGHGGGVGLFLARQIIKSHGGTIVVDDGRAGARFRIHLPIVDKSVMESVV